MTLSRKLIESFNEKNLSVSDLTSTSVKIVDISLLKVSLVDIRCLMEHMRMHVLSVSH